MLAWNGAVDGFEERVGEYDAVGACRDVDAVDGADVRVGSKDEFVGAGDGSEAVELYGGGYCGYVFDDRSCAAEVHGPNCEGA